MLPRSIAILITLAWLATATTAGFLVATETAWAPFPFASLPKSDVREEPVPSSATLTFVGDIMLAREVEKTLLEKGPDWPFLEIRGAWSASDLVVGNFEATVRDAYRDEGSVLAFDVLPELLSGLQNGGFTHLSLANNHGDDFGDEVTIATREAIAALGITPFGDPAASGDFIAHAEPNGIPISIVGFHAFTEYPASIVGAIAAENAAGRFVIVFPHWGNEYQTQPSQAQRDAAQQFVNAGADLIVGAHPHVIEPIELVDGVPVAWSLGNFIFDQDWSVATQEGLILHVTLSDNAVTIEAIPVDVIDRQARIMTSDRVQNILDFVGIPLGTITFDRPAATQTP